MKNKLLGILFSTLLLSACIEGPEVAERDVNDNNVATASASNFELVEDCRSAFPETRALIWEKRDGKDYVSFRWNKEDRFAVFPNLSPNDREDYDPASPVAGNANNEGASTNLYTLYADNNDNNASFFGGGFDLRKGVSYYALSPYFDGTVTDKKEEIVLSYAGQCQAANNDFSHLAEKDFQAAYAKASDEGKLHFAFKHLGCSYRIRIAITDGVHTFTKFEITTSKDYKLNPERTLDLTNGGAELDSYAASFAEATSEGTENFSLTLSKDGSGISAGGGTALNQLLVMYISLPATKEFVGQKVMGVLTEKDTGEKFYVNLTSREFVAGKAYIDDAFASPAKNLNISPLKINKRWQLGDTQAQTRAPGVGDPGIEDKLVVPDYLYVYTCVDDYLVDIQEIDASAAGWVEDGDYWIYKGDVIVDLSSKNPSTDVTTYIVASKDAIDPEQALTTSGTPSTSTTLDALSFGTPHADAEDLKKSQDLLKNLYSYKYTLTKSEFDTDPTLEAILYHTAAKLDVQWNSKSTLNGNVSVNNVANAGIKLFAPTENASGSQVYSEAITPATMYNGRAVFYVPQIAKSGSPAVSRYNITTGTGHIDNIDFEPSTTNSWTSWLKANITVNP